jgi:GNAT superfamily N-acetyltransferase
MWRASFEAGVGIVDPHPLADQRHYFLTEVLPHNRVRLAIAGGELVGFVAASAASIAQLYVRVGFWRQGIGVRLLNWAKEQSSGSLGLYTFARNAGARAFYERNGFVAVAYGFEPQWRLDDVRYQWIRAMTRA